MTSHRVKSAIAVFVFLGLACGASWAKKQANSAAGEEAAVKQTVNSFFDAFNKHDAHALAANFTEDADFINVLGVTTQGRKGVDEHYTTLFSDRFKDAHRTFSLKSVRFITPDVAAVTMEYELSGTKGPGGAEAPPAKGLYDWTLVKQNGRWLIATLHESNLPKATGLVPVR
ncbi:MAG: SgcJ/EcaC family oxidoreductase [Candidatus Acidiferrales bacterium]